MWKKGNKTVIWVPADMYKGNNLHLTDTSVLFIAILLKWTEEIKLNGTLELLERIDFVI